LPFIEKGVLVQQSSSSFFNVCCKFYLELN
jgi:hypothetical protein